VRGGEGRNVGWGEKVRVRRREGRGGGGGRGGRFWMKICEQKMRKCEWSSATTRGGATSAADTAYFWGPGVDA